MPSFILKGTLLVGWPLIQSNFGSTYVHSKTKLKQGIGALERSDGFLTLDESEMAEL